MVEMMQLKPKIHPQKNTHTPRTHPILIDLNMSAICVVLCTNAPSSPPEYPTHPQCHPLKPPSGWGWGGFLRNAM